MADPKPAETNYLPLILIVGLVVYFAFSQPREGGDPSKPVGVESVVKATIPNIRQAYRAAFLEAAKRIESGDIKDQEGWTKFIKENAGAKQREALDAVYEAIDKLELPVSFAGKEKEIAEINRKIGGAW
jgi:hypothetical protein